MADTIIGVGFQDTDEGRQALAVAAAIARRTGATLRVINVFEPFLFSDVALEEHEGLDAERALRQRSERAMRDALAGLPGDLEAEGVVVDGAVVPTLARLSSELDLLVLGSLGPASHGLMQAAACPVVVSPLPADIYRTSTRPTPDVSALSAAYGRRSSPSSRR